MGSGQHSQLDAALESDSARGNIMPAGCMPQYPILKLPETEFGLCLASSADQCTKLQLCCGLYHTIPYHHFISGDKAHTDNTGETRRQKITRPTVKNIKTQKTQNTIKTENEHTYTSTLLEVTLPNHYCTHSNVPHQLS